MSLRQSPNIEIFLTLSTEWFSNNVFIATGLRDSASQDFARKARNFQRAARVARKITLAEVAMYCGTELSAVHCGRERLKKIVKNRLVSIRKHPLLEIFWYSSRC